MTRYALISPSDKIDRYGIDIGPDVVMDPGWRWVPAPIADKPIYDPATQVLDGPMVTVGADAVTEAYTVRAKTTRELADETEVRREGILSGIGELVLRRLCDHESRIRMLEGKSAVTWEQCRKTIKDAL